MGQTMQSAPASSSFSSCRHPANMAPDARQQAGRGPRRPGLGLRAALRWRRRLGPPCAPRPRGPESRPTGRHRHATGGAGGGIVRTRVAMRAGFGTRYRRAGRTGLVQGEPRSGARPFMDPRRHARAPRTDWSDARLGWRAGSSPGWAAGRSPPGATCPCRRRAFRSSPRQPLTPAPGH